MEQEIENQIRLIRIARTRLNAEIKVAEQLMPDGVGITIHYNGIDRAIKEYPQFTALIKAMNS